MLKILTIHKLDESDHKKAFCEGFGKIGETLVGETISLLAVSASIDLAYWLLVSKVCN